MVIWGIAVTPMGNRPPMGDGGRPSTHESAGTKIPGLGLPAATVSEPASRRTKAPRHGELQQVWIRRWRPAWADFTGGGPGKPRKCSPYGCRRANRGRSVLAPGADI